MKKIIKKIKSLKIDRADIYCIGYLFFLLASFFQSDSILLFTYFICFNIWAATCYLRKCIKEWAVTSAIYVKRELLKNDNE